MRVSLCRATYFGDPIDTCRYVFTISTPTHKLQYDSHVVHTGYSNCIHNTFDNGPTIENLIIPEDTGKTLPSNRAHIVAIIHLSNNQDIASYSSPNFILDAQLTAMESAPHEHINSIFGRQFGVLINDEISSCARRLSNTKLMRCYSISDNCINGDFDNENYTIILDDNIHYCVPFKMRASIIDSLLAYVGFADDIAFNASESSDNFKFYHMSTLPASLDWTAAYKNDSSMKVILEKIAR